MGGAGRSGPPGTGEPGPGAVRACSATAVARRYSGSFAGLPRVRMFEAWNEPNASFFLSPAFENGQPLHAPASTARW